MGVGVGGIGVDVGGIGVDVGGTAVGCGVFVNSTVGTGVGCSGSEAQEAKNNRRMDKVELSHLEKEVDRLEKLNSELMLRNASL